MKTTGAILAAALMASTTPAIAQDTMSDTGYETPQWDQLIRTRDMTGSPVYTTNEAYDEGSWGAPEGDYAWGWSGYDGVGADWNQIGEIEDVVLDQSGSLQGVVVEVGGFLDIGDKHVLLNLTDVDLTPSDDGYALITRYNEEQLEELPSVDEGWWQ
ncbi:PRC-barrel domain protein [Pseudoroseicyclus aestuarii]|uniref:PRC-barrel domain protein n=2 Tax=Pseudoroseicyclus aestuarii TaxID=1795041 RepID=A0A318T2S9_9RHOB|nr:PRC-barrel domain protein [Pseudoroseicyclus aestuarii]